MDKTTITAAIRERVGAYLERDGVTKQNLAKQLGVSTVTLGSKLNGATEFSITEAIRLSQILGCTLNELISSPFGA